MRCISLISSVLRRCQKNELRAVERVHIVSCSSTATLIFSVWRNTILFQRCTWKNNSTVALRFASNGEEVKRCKPHRPYRCIYRDSRVKQSRVTGASLHRFISPVPPGYFIYQEGYKAKTFGTKKSMGYNCIENKPNTFLTNEMSRGYWAYEKKRMGYAP